MKKITLFVLIVSFFSVSPVYAATQGPLEVGTASGTNWSPDSGTLQTAVSASDDVRVTYNNTTQDDLILSNFGFSIPAGATIDGITVTREGSGIESQAVRRRYNIAVTKDASTVAGTQKTNQALPQTTDDTVNVGGAADLWGTTWTATEINSSNFGILIQDANSSAHTIRFDHVQVTVDYTPAVSRRIIMVD